MIDEKILNILRKNTGAYISGEDLCKDAGISRAAIWKRIENLREEGYEIEASPHVGYRLTSVPDRLIPAEVKWGIRAEILGREIISYEKVDSTNDVAYSLAEKGVKEGTVIFAEEQARGKGRLGRNWYSPPMTGIYMSCILRPKILPNEIARITLLAAVAVAGAIREAAGLAASIKWPNDILINGRKVSGILTEIKAEQDFVKFVILGIGVNVNTPRKYIPRNGSSLKDENARSGKTGVISRIEIARSILEHLEKSYEILRKNGFAPIIDQWKNLSGMLGSTVKVVREERSFEGQAYDIDKDGSLLVRRDHGILEKVSSGDVLVIG